MTTEDNRKARLTKLVAAHGKPKAAELLRVTTKTLDEALGAGGYRKISLRRIAAAERLITAGE